jgi:single-strand DNA-binding protein
VAWEKTAEFVRDYLGKGRRECVEGRLQVREWEDKQSGQKRTAYEIVASRVDFMDSAPQGRQESAPERPSTRAPSAPQGNFDDQVPF